MGVLKAFAILLMLFLLFAAFAQSIYQVVPAFY